MRAMTRRARPARHAKRVVAADESWSADNNASAGRGVDPDIPEIRDLDDMVMVRDIPVSSHCRDNNAFVREAHVAICRSRAWWASRKFARLIDVIMRAACRRQEHLKLADHHRDSTRCSSRAACGHARGRAHLQGRARVCREDGRQPSGDEPVTQACSAMIPPAGCGLITRGEREIAPRAGCQDMVPVQTSLLAPRPRPKR